MQDDPIPVITGPSTRAYKVKYESGDSWLGIRLRPDRAVMLWQKNIGKAADKVLRGQDAIAMLPQLVGINRHELSFAQLAKALEAITMPEHGTDQDSRLLQALNALHVSGGRLPIEKIAALAGCTTRQLNRMFRSNVGLSAKTYSQLVQFHRTLKLLQKERLPITAAAFEGGYADQSHLTRAFQRFGSFTPLGLSSDLYLPELFM
jgi:AraC-like DNA-binding protein